MDLFGRSTGLQFSRVSQFDDGGSVVLHKLSFGVQTGGITALHGTEPAIASISGILAGGQRPARGRVKLHGAEITDPSSADRRVDDIGDYRRVYYGDSNTSGIALVDLDELKGQGLEHARNVLDGLRQSDEPVVALATDSGVISELGADAFSSVVPVTPPPMAMAMAMAMVDPSVLPPGPTTPINPGPSQDPPEEAA
jgi:hypothetical protein